MATKSDRISSLELTIVEQRRDSDLLERLYEHSKTKNITFIAASFALLVYLFANQDGPTLRNKLFIPEEPYGVIIYAISFVLFISGVILLFAAMRPFPWSTAYEANEEEYVPEDYETYLRFYKKRYDRISSSNCKSYATKQRLLNISFVLLIAGGIMLIVLKIFRG